MCKQIQHVSDGPKIWFIRVKNRYFTDRLIARDPSVFKGSRLLNTCSITSASGTYQVNIGRCFSYIFGLCVTYQIAGL